MSSVTYFLQWPLGVLAGTQKNTTISKLPAMQGILELSSQSKLFQMSLLFYTASL
jgi:hypothetical protein